MNFTSLNSTFKVDFASFVSNDFAVFFFPRRFGFVKVKKFASSIEAFFIPSKSLSGGGSTAAGYLGRFLFAMRYPFLLTD